MSTISSRIISIYKSRTTLLAQLQKQGYNIDDYSSFTINEIDYQLSSSSLARCSSTLLIHWSIVYANLIFI